jgi:LPS-assembly protein
VRAAATISLLLLLSASVAAQTSFEADAERGLRCWAEPEPLAPVDLGDSIEMTSENADIDADGSGRFTGPVTLRSSDKMIKASSASYDAKTTTFSASGDIEFRYGDNTLTGESLSYNTSTEEFSFIEGEFVIVETPARGTAGKLEVTGKNYMRLSDVFYTSCPPGNNDWRIKAKSIELDSESGYGTARGASIAFKGVPFMYLPYFTYPISDKRKSGFLFPKFGTSDQRGFELETPIYWNIRPNMDATIVPRYMGKRGLQLGTEYRFLAKRHEGMLWGDYLPDDDETGSDRWLYDVETESMLGWQTRATISASGVSDNNYFEDLSSNRQLTSKTNLDRRLDLERNSRHWTLLMRVEDFQTIDDAILPEDDPYAQLPQVVANGEWRDGALGLDYKLGSEAVYFYRDTGTTGARLHVQPEISLPLDYRGFYLTPQIAYDYTAYRLEDQPTGQADNPSRHAPIGSIDTGATFDRLVGKNSGLLVTLEPRIQYVYIPYRDQSDIPIFDTIVTDFNLVQLFRRNRFIGYDRLGDTNQLSAGVTSRILDANNGRQLLAVTLGQTRYFDESQVTFANNPSSTTDASNYIAELDVRTWENWSAGSEMQWDTERNKVDRASARLQYRPGARKSINAGYRFVRESSEQTDFAFSWPLSKKWSALGRYNYSMLEKKPLDRFLGIEFESCCWAIRVLGRRSVTRSTGEQDTSVSFQFELKGFSNIGSGAINSLERGILGDWTR